MMDDVYVYTLPLPPKVREIVTPCIGGYTVYLSDRLDDAHRLKAYRHALEHIRRGDLYKDDVQRIEAEAHGAVVPAAPPVRAARRRKTKAQRLAELRLDWCYDHGVDPIEDALDRRDRQDMFFPR